MALIDPIHQAAAEDEDTLLIYYAGHGLVHPRTLGLLLAVVGSSPGRTYTAVPYDEVRHNVIDSRAIRKVVILDCCYSGRAAGGQADPSSAVANEATIEGTYLLASAPPNKMSLSPSGETYTAFTGALLKILTEGLPNGRSFSNSTPSTGTSGTPSNTHPDPNPSFASTTPPASWPWCAIPGTGH